MAYISGAMAVRMDTTGRLMHWLGSARLAFPRDSRRGDVKTSRRSSRAGVAGHYGARAACLWGS